MPTVTISVRIQGTTPLLMNRFTDEAAQAIMGGVSKVSLGERGTPREQAAKKVYCDEQGVIFVPGPNIFRCIVDAGQFHKAGRSKITTTKSSLVPAAMTITEIACPLASPTKEPLHWEVDSRSVVIPSTGGRIMAHRPRFDRWTLAFTVEVDTTLFSLSVPRLLIDDGGRRIGLGDFRPARKGPFGKFVVTNWEERT